MVCIVLIGKAVKYTFNLVPDLRWWLYLYRSDCISTGLFYHLAIICGICACVFVCFSRTVQLIYFPLGVYCCWPKEVQCQLIWKHETFNINQTKQTALCAQMGALLQGSIDTTAGLQLHWQWSNTSHGSMSAIQLATELTNVRWIKLCQRSLVMSFSFLDNH